MKKYYLLFVVFLFVCGCARAQESFKLLWGTSTKALEDSRASATVKTYECFPGSCFDKILDIVNSVESLPPSPGSTPAPDTDTEEAEQIPSMPINDYEVFIKDRKNNRIVLVGIPGSIDTTEVGIFITAPKLKESKVEVISLSTAAQEKVAELIFPQLDKAFPQITEIAL